MKVISRMPRAARLVLGLLLTVVMLFVCAVIWGATRKWVPLNASVPITKGHARTSEFEINVESSYEIRTWWQRRDDSTSSSPSGKWAWTLSSNGRVVAQGHSSFASYSLETFFARKGRYILDIDPPADALGYVDVAITERGDIQAVTFEWLNRAFLLLLGCSAFGIVFVIFWLVKRRSMARDAEAFACPLTQPGVQSPGIMMDATIRRPWKGRASPLQLYTRFSWHSYLLLIVLLNLHVIVWATRPVVPTGLLIRLQPRGIQNPRIPGMDPVLVYVAYEHKLFVNSRPVAWEQLDTTLEKELRLRPPGWPVYIQGDDNLEWEAVVRAIDIAQGKHVPVILVTTPSSR